MAIDQNEKIKNRNVASAKLYKNNTTTHKVGDAVERAGEKIKNIGAEKIGNAIYKAGNKIEHSRDNK